jgi:hypothetical protein
VNFSLTSFANDFLPANFSAQLLDKRDDPALFDALSGLVSTGGKACKNAQWIKGSYRDHYIISATSSCDTNLYSLSLG